MIKRSKKLSLTFGKLAFVVGTRYLTQSGYPVTGSVNGNILTLSIPLSALGLKAGDRIYDAAAFATAAPSESDPLAESGRVRLRLNFDVFNVFNRQGLNTPASDGIVTLQNSYGGFGFRPRQVQITARLEW